MEKHPPPAKKAYYLRSQNVGQSAALSLATNFKTAKEFRFFPKLPQELRMRIWEMAVEDGRIVAVHSVTGKGLRSSVPSILHVSSESRVVGLKHYTLCFSALDYPPEPKDPSSESEGFRVKVPIPARVYFNFNRDTLYFREDWNHGVDGPWSCIYQLGNLIDKEDLEKVKAVGFNLDAKICSSRSSLNHHPNFARWTGLKTMYLGLEKLQLPAHIQIELRELQSEDYSTFLKEYRRNSSWSSVTEVFDDASAMEYMQAVTISVYRAPGMFQKLKGHEGLRPVHVVEL